MTRYAAQADPYGLDRRTELEKARDELTGDLRGHGDLLTVATVLRFVDRWAEHLRRRVGMDYSAEAFAFGRVASELERCAAAAGMRMPTAEQLTVIMAPVAPPPVAPDPDRDLVVFEQDDQDRARSRTRLKYKPSKWNRRRGKRQ